MSDEVSWIRNRMAGCLAVCIVLVSQVWADPDIQVTGVSGSFDAGAVVTITGLGFGTKIPAAPFLWDDFEGGTNGSAIGDPVIGGYSRTFNSAYSSQNPYSGSLCSYSALNDETDVNGQMGLISDWIPAEAKDAFASMKFRIFDENGDIAPNNVKLLRLNASDPDPTHGYPNYNIGKENGPANWYGIVNHGLVGQVYFGGFSAFADNEAWQSVSIWDHLGTPDVANGFVGREINGVTAELQDIVTLQSGHGDGLRSAYFCGWANLFGVGLNLYLDNVYADTTLSRVVAYDPDGGNLEMQIPQAWNQNSIEILVNTGRYVSGTDLNLIVYDKDNNASAPFVVTVGEGSGGGDLGPPGMPSTPVFE